MITLLLLPAGVVVAVFFLAGVAQAVAQSLGYQPYLPARPLSFDAYRALAADPAVRTSLLLTARVAGLSTVLAAIAGVTIALTVRRLGRSRTTVTGLVQLNLGIPHLAGALCMLLLLGQTGLASRIGSAAGLSSNPQAFPALVYDRFGWGIIAEYVWKEAPFFAVLALAASGRGLDDLQDAARTLGAGPWRRLTRVTLPLLAPSVITGSVLVFAFAAGSYEVPYLLGRPYPATLPVVAYQLYSDTDLDARPEAMAVAVLIAVLSGVVVVAYLSVSARLARRSL